MLNTIHTLHRGVIESSFESSFKQPASSPPYLASPHDNTTLHCISRSDSAPGRTHRTPNSINQCHRASPERPDPYHPPLLHPPRTLYIHRESREKGLFESKSLVDATFSVRGFSRLVEEKSVVLWLSYAHRDYEADARLRVLGENALVFFAVFYRVIVEVLMQTIVCYHTLLHVLVWVSIKNKYK